jgi:biotin carboxylase
MVSENPPQHKILVTGTTPDYIQWIRLSCPDRALFITQPDLRQGATEDPPGDEEEILVSLADKDQVLATLLAHLKNRNQTLDAVVSFDCESMALASFIAGQLALDYPSVGAIQNARDKCLSKQLWQDRQIGCPRISPVDSVSEAIEFFNTTESGCVLKPFTGSGSELVFHCKRPSDCSSAFAAIKTGLARRTGNPLFNRMVSDGRLMLAEEYMEGPEYSCDFIIENQSVRIIRLAKKIKSSLTPFGTIKGYLLPGSLPKGLGEQQLHDILLRGAAALGIKRAICMVDFIISKGQMMLIEMTPRPGGDCLPHMLKVCAGFDMLKTSLDFAAKLPLALPDTQHIPACVALRIHAKQEGVLKNINCRRLMDDPRIKSIHLTRKPGHEITLPPQDYDSWLLGHVIMNPLDQDSPEQEALAVLENIEILMEKPEEKKINHA